MKKNLSILILVFCLFFSTSCDFDKSKKLTVENGIAALKDINNYVIKFDMSSINELDENEDMIKINMEVQDNVKKIELLDDDITYSFYLLNESTEDVEEKYIILNPSLLGGEYQGDVKISMTEIKELIYGTPDFEESASSQEQAIITAYKNLINFFVNLKDYYFDLVDVEDYYYIFNESGKAAFDEAVNEFNETLTGDVTTLEQLDIDIEVTVQVDEKYVTNLLIDLIGKNIDESETETIRINAEFEKFGKVELTLPNKVISFKEYMEYLENTYPSEPEVNQ